MSTHPSDPSNPGPGPGAPHTSVESPDGSKKIVAGVLAILLGAFGIHKFVLGMTKPGLIMLLVTVLSCSILSPVMAIIGIIEGVIYLTKSDQEFHDLYVVGQKEWF